MSGPEDYTIGWICALPIEYAAAQLFLDKTHDPLESIAPGDNNGYTLGKMGQHNVVLTVLPDTEYGTASAATAVTDMTRSFPNIRICLMVGIGGGVPSSTNDVRLGDVVVGTHIIQYDFGKTVQGQTFQETKHLNKPPRMLLTAVNGLKAKYLSEGHQIADRIESILKDRKSTKEAKRLQKHFGQPGADSDRLFIPDYVHPTDHDDRPCECGAVGGLESKNLMERPARDDDDDFPLIHFGPIASGNQVMKDALIRDNYGRSKEVLCFEMEAAGLMNNFPCLVIRGISDYADSHKNDRWKGFAAMTAAGYAKDLLGFVLPSSIREAPKLQEILVTLKTSLDEVSETVKNLASCSDRTQAIVQSGAEHQYSIKLKYWLSPPDPTANLNRASEQKLEHSNSGTWLLKSDLFSDWMNSSNSFLWLHGASGCGKTVLSSTIIQHLSETADVDVDHAAVLFFFFDFSDVLKQTIHGMLRSLIHQLYLSREESRAHLDTLFTACRNGNAEPSSKQLCECFFAMLPDTKQTWIILDGLDECTTRSGDQNNGLLKWLEALHHVGLENMHLLTTSRFEKDIWTDLNHISESIVRYAIPSHNVEEDICHYVNTVVREGRVLGRWNQIWWKFVQDEIVESLIAKSDGMFRWVACQLDILEQCYSYPEVQNALKSLPRTMAETYQRILSSIRPEFIDTAIRILQFVTYSERNLTLSAIADLVAVNLDEEPPFQKRNRMPRTEEILHFCTSLLVIQEDLVFLAHLSVKEFLTSNMLCDPFRIQLSRLEASASATIISLAYLSVLEHRAHQSLTAIEVDFPALRYCALTWMGRARDCEEKERIQRHIRKFFYKKRQSCIRWLEFHYHCISGDSVRPGSQLRSGGRLTPAPSGFWGGFRAAYGAATCTQLEDLEGHYNALLLHCMSLQGMRHQVSKLLQTGADPNIPCDNYGCALQAAAYYGHEETVHILLANQALVNEPADASLLPPGLFLTGSRSCGNALNAAAASGHEAIARILIDNGAHVNAHVPSKFGYGASALYIAARNGNSSMVRLLVENGARIESGCGRLGTALHAATHGGHEEIVEYLVGCGPWADVNLTVPIQQLEWGDYTPLPSKSILQLAVSRGHESLVRLLIRLGADVNYMPSEGPSGSILHEACRSRNEVILRLLLDNGAEVDAVSSVFGTAIQLATQIGAIRMVEVLIEKGANVNMDGGYYGESLINATALDIAKWNGDGQMYRLLECNGAFSSSVCPTMDDSEDHWQPESSFRQERERLRKLQTHRKADSEDPYARPGHPLTFHSKNQPAVFF